MMKQTAILFVLATTLTWTSVALAAAPTQNQIAEVKAILDRNLGVRTALASGPGLRNDASFIGNGEVKASFYGVPESYRMLLERDDCFYDQGGGKYGRLGTLVAGEMELAIPALKDVPYRQEQDMYSGEVRLVAEANAVSIRISSKVLRTTHGLVLTEITNKGTAPLEVSLRSFATPSDDAKGKTIHRMSGITGRQIVWSSRRNEPCETGKSFWESYRKHLLEKKRDTLSPDAVKMLQEDTGRQSYSMWIAMATRILDSSVEATVADPETAVSTFKVAPGSSVRMVTGVVSTGIPLTVTPEDPQSRAATMVEGITVDGLAKLENESQASWDEYWTRSFISIQTYPLLERAYYGYLYALASSHRPHGGGYAPGIGGWACWDTQGTPWGNGYTFNYNIQSIYWGIYSANRAGLDDGYFRVLRETTDKFGRKLALMEELPGITVPSGGGIQGVMNWNFAQRSNAIEAAMPLIHHWYYTYDRDWLKEVFPWLLALADYWDASLARDRGADGKYHVLKSGLGEGPSPYSSDVIAPLAFLKLFYKGMLDISKETGLAVERREKWADYLANLAPYEAIRLPNGKPVPAVADGITFEKDFHYGKWGMHGMPLSPVFPGNEVGLTPDIREWFRNAIDCGRLGNYTEASRAAHWGQENNFPYIYTAATRLRWDFQGIVGRANDVFTRGDHWKNKLGGNNFYKQMGGYIETCGWIEAINSMLLQSQNGYLEFFPHWDNSEANVVNLRAMGGFLVSAAYKQNRPQTVTVVSERGRPCRFLSPWKNQWPFYPGIRVVDSKKVPIEVVEKDGVFEIPTRAGESYRIDPVPAERGR